MNPNATHYKSFIVSVEYALQATDEAHARLFAHEWLVPDGHLAQRLRVTSVREYRPADQNPAEPEDQAAA